MKIERSKRKSRMGKERNGEEAAVMAKGGRKKKERSGEIRERGQKRKELTSKMGLKVEWRRMKSREKVREEEEAAIMAKGE